MMRYFGHKRRKGEIIMERGFAVNKLNGIQKWTIEGNKRDIYDLINMIEDIANNTDTDNVKIKYSIGLNSSLKFLLEII